MHGPVALALATLLAAAPTLSAQDGPVWRHQSDAKIQHFTVDVTGALVVRTDSGEAAFDGADGHVLWRRPAAAEFRGLGMVDVGIIRSASAFDVIDLATGTTRWSMKATPLIELTGYQSLPAHNLVLLYGPTPESPLSVVAVSLDSGVVRWRQDTLFARVKDLPKQAKKLALTVQQPKLEDSDSTLLLYPSRGGPMRLNLVSGALLWRADTLAREEPRWASAGYAAMAADSTAVYVPYGKRLMALDRESGRVLWDRRAEFPSFPAEVVPTARGILVRGYYKKKDPSEDVAGSLELLDPATGISRWPKPMRDIHDAAAMLVAGDTVYLAAKQSLMMLDLGNGQLRELQKLDWHGGEVPWRMERIDSALVVSSSQNLAGLDAAGHLLYQRYYPAPGASLFSKLASTTLLLAVNVANAAVAQSAANRYHTTVMYPVFVDNPVLHTRYKATVEAERYLHVLTKAADDAGRKGFSVVRVDKASGKEAGRVWVDDRSPDYVLDAAAGTVYLMRDDRSIEAFRF